MKATGKQSANLDSTSLSPRPIFTIGVQLYGGFRMKKLKEKVLEIVKIAQECPENFQQSCFEILLKHELCIFETPKGSPGGQDRETFKEREKSKGEPKSVVEKSATSQDDLSSADLHLKTRRFLEKQGLSVDHLNLLFYKEGEQIHPLYENLKTTRTSESQIRITFCFNVYGMQSEQVSSKLKLNLLVKKPLPESVMTRTIGAQITQTTQLFLISRNIPNKLKSSPFLSRARLNWLK